MICLCWKCVHYTSGSQSVVPGVKENNAYPQTKTRKEKSAGQLLLKWSIPIFFWGPDDSWSFFVFRFAICFSDLIFTCYFIWEACLDTPMWGQVSPFYFQFCFAKAMIRLCGHCPCKYPCTQGEGLWLIPFCIPKPNMAQHVLGTQ